MMTATAKVFAEDARTRQKMSAIRCDKQYQPTAIMRSTAILASRSKENRRVEQRYE